MLREAIIVNILQVVKWTNTLYFLNKWRRRQVIGLEVVGSNPNIHQQKKFSIFPMSNLKNVLSDIIPRKWNRLDIDTSARTSGRPSIPPFQGGRVL